MKYPSPVECSVQKKECLQHRETRCQPRITALLFISSPCGSTYDRSEQMRSHTHYALGGRSRRKGLSLDRFAGFKPPHLLRASMHLPPLVALLLWIPIGAYFSIVIR